MADPPSANGAGTLEARFVALERTVAALRASSGADTETGREGPWTPSRPVSGDVADVIDDGSPAVYRMKVVVVGRAGVGKTSWLRQLCEGRFDPAGARTTLAVDYYRIYRWAYHRKYELELWDTAGLERAGAALMPGYLRGAHGVVVMLDITARDSLVSAGALLDELGRELDSAQTSVIVVGSKLDRAHVRAVPADEAGHMAASHGAWYMECTAVDLTSARAPLTELVRDMVNAGRFTPVDTRAQAPQGRGLRLDDAHAAAAAAAAGRGGCAC